MSHPFHPFTGEHYAALIVGFAAMGGFLMAGKKGGASQRRATALLALINFSVYPLSLAAWSSVADPKSIENYLPLHMCDIAAMTAGIALVTRRPLFCTITYFWGLAATVQALITPALTLGYPSAPYFMFFVHHFVVVIAALYIPIVQGWRPKSPLWRSPIEAFGVSVIYLFFVLVVNHLTGSNFAFVSRPPDTATLINHLGPWPWYIFSLLGLALVLYSALVLPFIRRKP